MEGVGNILTDLVVLQVLFAHAHVFQCVLHLPTHRTHGQYCPSPTSDLRLSRNAVGEETTHLILVQVRLGEVVGAGLC